MIHFYELASRVSTQRARLLRRAEIQIDDLFACYACQDCRCSSKKHRFPKHPSRLVAFLPLLCELGDFTRHRELNRHFLRVK